MGIQIELVTLQQKTRARVLQAYSTRFELVGGGTQRGNETGHHCAKQPPRPQVHIDATEQASRREALFSHATAVESQTESSGKSDRVLASLWLPTICDLNLQPPR